MFESYCRSNVKRNTQKHCFALTGSLPRENYRSGTINIGNVFSHITLKKGVCDFPDVVWFFFYTLLKFDILNAGVSFHYRSHNSEMEAKLNKARHPFSKEVIGNIPADFQLIPLEDTRKRT